MCMAFLARLKLVFITLILSLAANGQKRFRAWRRNRHYRSGFSLVFFSVCADKSACREQCEKRRRKRTNHFKDFLTTSSSMRVRLSGKTVNAFVAPCISFGDYLACEKQVDHRPFSSR